MQDKSEETRLSSNQWWNKAKGPALNNCTMSDVGRDSYNMTLTCIGPNYTCGAVAGPSTEKLCSQLASTNAALREMGIPHDRPIMASGNDDLSKIQGTKDELEDDAEALGALPIQGQSGCATDVGSPSSSEPEATAAYVAADLRVINCSNWKTLDCEVAPIDTYTSRAEMYALSMLTHEAGYPLYMPEPYKGLPTAYRKTGVKIGDVGVITPNGTFDFLFNACQSRDYHPSTNPAKLPIDFEALEPDIAVEKKFSPGVYLTSSHVNFTKNPPTVDFQCLATNGAALALPEGATMYQALNRLSFQKHAARHAISWYRYMLDRGRDSPNGSLYFVTECVKSRNWGIAAFYGKSRPNDYLRFVPLEIPARKIHHRLRPARVLGMSIRQSCSTVQASYYWDHSGKVEPRIGPAWTDIIANHDEPNQCIFLRGYKIMLRQDIWENLRNSIEVPSRGGQSSLLDSAGSANSPTRNGNFPGQNSTSTSGNQDASSSSDKGYQRGELTTQQMEVKSESADHNANALADADNSLESGQVTLKENAIIPSPAHPSDLINDTLLQRNPTAKVAVTHDSEWCDNLPPEFCANPRKSKFGSLLENVDRTYTSIVDEHGCAVLVNPNPQAIATQNARSLSVRHAHHRSGYPISHPIRILKIGYDYDSKSAKKSALIGQDDIVIMVMGNDSAEKSSFIKLISGDNSVIIGTGLKSDTSDIQVVSFHDPESGRNVIIVDSPVFGDPSACVTNTRSLKKIVKFLLEIYDKGRKLNGLVYLISDFGFSRQSLRDLMMFRNLCGTKAYGNVVVLTTFLDELPGSQEGDDWGEEPKTTFFRDLLDGGALFMRHNRSLQSARDVLRHISTLIPTNVRIQEEIRMEGKALEDTTAGSVQDQTIAKREIGMSKLEDVLEMMEEVNSILRHELDEPAGLQRELVRWATERGKLRKGLSEVKGTRQWMEADCVKEEADKKWRQDHERRWNSRVEGQEEKEGQTMPIVGSLEWLKANTVEKHNDKSQTTKPGRVKEMADNEKWRQNHERDCNSRIDVEREKKGLNMPGEAADVHQPKVHGNTMIHTLPSPPPLLQQLNDAVKKCKDELQRIHASLEDRG